MTHLAILGAGSRIAQDFIAAAKEKHALSLYARRPEPVHGLPVAPFADFGKSAYDAVINFVGAGDPAKAKEMERTIMDTTREFDRMAIEYVRRHKGCRYLFLSSGAVYGGDFARPVTEDSPVPSGKTPESYYAAAKIEAEERHRAEAELPIVDIRLFNYFSRGQDLSARFFITDAVRALKAGQLFKTSPANMTRDYLHPTDFYRLVKAILAAAPANAALDAYSRAPVDKLALLEDMKKRFGLKYEVTGQPVDAVNATGSKTHYYSTSRRAAGFGYAPRYTSLEGLALEIAAIMGRKAI